jgi:hypothetical protein
MKQLTTGKKATADGAKHLAECRNHLPDIAGGRLPSDSGRADQSMRG